MCQRATERLAEKRRERVGVQKLVLNCGTERDRRVFNKCGVRHARRDCAGHSALEPRQRRVLRGDAVPRALELGGPGGERGRFAEAGARNDSRQSLRERPVEPVLERAAAEHRRAYGRLRPRRACRRRLTSFALRALAPRLDSQWTVAQTRPVRGTAGPFTSTAGPVHLEPGVYQVVPRGFRWQIGKTVARDDADIFYQGEVVAKLGGARFERYVSTRGLFADSDTDWGSFTVVFGADVNLEISAYAWACSDVEAGGAV